MFGCQHIPERKLLRPRLVFLVFIDIDFSECYWMINIIVYKDNVAQSVTIISAGANHSGTYPVADVCVSVTFQSHVVLDAKNLSTEFFNTKY